MNRKKTTSIVFQRIKKIYICT